MRGVCVYDKLSLGTIRGLNMHDSIPHPESAAPETVSMYPRRLSFLP
jgi:hypothetical protein